MIMETPITDIKKDLMWKFRYKKTKTTEPHALRASIESISLNTSSIEFINSESTYIENPISSCLYLSMACYFMSFTKAIL